MSVRKAKYRTSNHTSTHRVQHGAHLVEAQAPYFHVGLDPVWASTPILSNDGLIILADVSAPNKELRLGFLGDLRCDGVSTGLDGTLSLGESCGMRLERLRGRSLRVGPIFDFRRPLLVSATAL